MKIAARGDGTCPHCHGTLQVHPTHLHTLAYTTTTRPLGEGKAESLRTTACLSARVTCRCAGQVLRLTGEERAKLRLGLQRLVKVRQGASRRQPGRASHGIGPVYPLGVQDKALAWREKGHGGPPSSPVAAPPTPPDSLHELEQVSALPAPRHHAHRGLRPKRRK